MDYSCKATAGRAFLAGEVGHSTVMEIGACHFFGMEHVRIYSRECCFVEFQGFFCFLGRHNCGDSTCNHPILSYHCWRNAKLSDTFERQYTTQGQLIMEMYNFEITTWVVGPQHVAAAKPLDILYFYYDRAKFSH